MRTVILNGKMPIYLTNPPSKVISRTGKLGIGYCYWQFLFAFCVLSLFLFSIVINQNSVNAFKPINSSSGQTGTGQTGTGQTGTGQTGTGQTGTILEKPITQPSGTNEEKIFTINIGAKDPNSLNTVTPKALVVRSGTTVTWLNNDDSAHRIASGSAEKGPTNVFYSDYIDPGKNFTLDTRTPGVYEFYDPLWNNIKGTLTVIGVKQLGGKTESTTRSLSSGQQEPDRQEPDRQEPDRQEPDRQEPDRQEPDRQEPDRQEPDRQEPDRQEPDRQEPDRQEPDRQEPDRQEPDRQEPDRQEPDRQEPDRQEPDRQEPDRQEPDKCLML